MVIQAAVKNELGRGKTSSWKPSQENVVMIWMSYSEDLN